MCNFGGMGPLSCLLALYHVHVSGQDRLDSLHLAFEQMHILKAVSTLLEHVEPIQ